MKHLLFAVGLTLAVVAVGVVTHLSEPTFAASTNELSIDTGGIEAVQKAGRLLIRVPVVNSSSERVSSAMTVQITDLEGNILLQEKTTAELPTGKSIQSVELPGSISAERNAEGVIHIVLNAGTFTQKATKSLFEAVPQLETRLIGYLDLIAGSRATVRLVSLNHATGEPVAGAGVQIRLAVNNNESILYTGKTNSNGSIDAQFDVPETNSSAELRVRVTADGLGEDTIVQPVGIKRKTKILLTTDKPLYQPGQMIRMRALSMRAGDLLPEKEKPLIFEVMDPKGNKVFKKKVDTDRFGVASAEFSLASEVNLGAYIVRATLEDNTSEKQVTVDRYVLPKFKIQAKTDRDYYLPGETLKGEIQADYFFGKPVSGGKVRVVASKFEINFEKFGEVEGVLDPNGHWTFELPLPTYFAGTPIEQGNASIRLEVEVVDTADHREEKVIMKPVAPAPLNVFAVPEGGVLMSHLENRVYVLVSYPDGTPAAGATVRTSLAGLNSQDGSVTTDDLGIATLRVSPEDNSGEISAAFHVSDKKGNAVNKSVPLSVKAATENIILRTDKALYTAGDRLHAEAITTRTKGTVYFDLVREGQTVLTRTADIAAGKATLDLDLDGTLAGSVMLHAYTFTPATDLVRDTRLLYVNPADAIGIQVQLDQETYKPGEKAQIRFATVDRGGSPIPAALGITIVDESVFALQEIHPGLEKVYFTLEQEIMKPRFEIHGYELTELVRLPDDRPIPLKAVWSEQQQQAARVLLASAPPPTDPPVRLNTFEQKTNAAKEAAQKKFQKDWEHISKAVSQLLEKNAGKPIEDIKQELLRQKLLRPNDLIDPWDNPYEFDFTKTVSWGGYFVMTSWGPDGKKGTADDLSSESIFPRRNRGGGGWDGIVILGASPEALGAAAGAAKRRQSLAVPAPTMASGQGGGGGQEPPRIREYFPETLLFEPALITDAQGIAHLDVDMADSITTWRMNVMASGQNGALGSREAPIRVFQDFFVDIDLPVSLTQNDEVSIPVVVYNYLDQPQDVRLKFETAPWFRLKGEPEQTLHLNTGEVRSVYFPMEVVELGNHKLTVFAYGSKMNDAIRREIEVRPDGEEKSVSFSDRLSGPIEHTVEIPQDAIPGASKILVRIYPGVFSQIVDGLDSMLQMPFGCFEQTSSVTYPNILIVQYLKATKQINPEIQMKAEGFINAGYQRLLSYEVDGGGFSWFGDAPANQVLTAWGLKEFYDMSQVHEVDPAVLKRTRGWLLSKQQADGSWKPDESYLHAESWGGIQNNTVLVTAYILDAILNIGAAPDKALKAIDYLRANVKDTKEAYTLSLIANALVSWKRDDAFTNDILARLYELRQEDDKVAHWKGTTGTVTFSEGDAADIETTALATIAFLKAGKYPETTTKALTYLIQKKTAQGHWGSTQATILALKALTLSLGSRTETVNATITLTLNGEETQEIKVTPEDSDVMRLIDLGEKTKPGANRVALDITGKGSMLYQIVGRYYTPWGKRPQPSEGPLSITVKYDKTELAVNDLVTTTVTVRNNLPVAAQMVVVDLGIPPGFDVIAADLDQLVTDKKIQKYELTGRQIIVYFERLDALAVVEFSYKLRARFPMRAQTPESRAYEYYNPEVHANAAPQLLTVQ